MRETLHVSKMYERRFKALKGQHHPAIAAILAHEGLDLTAFEHGTEAGYQTHRRRGEPACTLCKVGHVAHQTARRDAAKMRAGARADPALL